MINNLLRTIFLIIIVSLPALSQVKPIIGVAGIAHESNSFNVIKTELSDFHVTLGESLKSQILDEISSTGKGKRTKKNKKRKFKKSKRRRRR